MDYRNWGLRATRRFGPGDPQRAEDLRLTLPLRGRRAEDLEETVSLQGPEPRGGLSRRVLFTAGGLSLIGGAGIATAKNLTPSGSASAIGSPAPSKSPIPAQRVAPPPASPSDLSSSTASATTPPPATQSPGALIDPSQVQSAPEYYVHAGPKVIALTLDDGPNNVYTPQILALLQQHAITATFCMIGEQIAASRGIVHEVAAAGHMVVNHTWNHADQSKLALTAIKGQIARTSDALNASGIEPSVFRAPYGAWSPAVFKACAAARLRPLDWSVDPRDWSRPGTSTIISRIMKQTRTGSIILEHDGGGDRSETVAALAVVLPELLAAGYRFTTV